MLTADENELLSHIGPGTPAGELMRQYWLPFAVARELTDKNPTRFVRLLGEDLVLFRDKSGNVGLLGDHCSHRGAAGHRRSRIRPGVGRTTSSTSTSTSSRSAS